MKRIVLGMMVGAVVATAGVAANASQYPDQSQKKGHEITVTGCLVQGSSPTVFLLQNARLNPKDRNEKATAYRLIAATEDLNFSKQLNHEVSVTGTGDQASAMSSGMSSRTSSTSSTSGTSTSAGQRQTMNENELPKLEATIVTTVADSCTTSSQPGGAR